MSTILSVINSIVYFSLQWEIQGYKSELESKEYGASSFTLNNLKIISRNSKQTPKKTGQFVTFWKRTDHHQPIQPFGALDIFDLLIVNSTFKGQLGQFVFPKSVLIEKGIVSTENKEGKRAFRVYPPWDKVISKQAITSQKWQQDYFYRIDKEMDMDSVEQLYGVNQ